VRKRTGLFSGPRECASGQASFPGLFSGARSARWGHFLRRRAANQGDGWKAYEETHPYSGREGGQEDRHLDGGGALILASTVSVGIFASSHGNGRRRQTSFCEVQ
jgi:hypothetical protein